jgi:hypothetical protein
MDKKKILANVIKRKEELEKIEVMTKNVDKMDKCNILINFLDGRKDKLMKEIEEYNNGSWIRKLKIDF